jgi:SAM-dependent methyltransferase
VLDYSMKALVRSRQFFERAGITGEFVEANALALPEPLRGAFDVSMSYGLAEHFSGAERAQIIAAHLQVLRHGGVALISVPNAANPPYRVYKALAELAGFWGSGEEYPFRRRELERLMAELGVTDFGFFGDSFARSWQWLSPVRIGRKLLKRPEHTDVSRIRPEKEGGLDERWSYALVLWAVKGVRER